MAAEVMGGLGYKVMKLATPLKDMLRSLLRTVGVTPADIERMIEGDLKEVPTNKLNGKSPRFAMQRLGEEWGRQNLGEDFWLNRALDTVRYHQTYVEIDAPVFIDDLRYLNEFSGLKREGFTIWKITGRVQKDVGQHSSEVGLPDHMFDHVFHNTSTEAKFKEDVRAELFRLAMCAERMT